MEEFTFEKCKTKGAYSAKLKHNKKLELKNLKGKFEIVSETPVLYLIKADGYNIVVHAYGEILFKEGTNVDEMKELSAKIYSILLKKVY